MRLSKVLPSLCLTVLLIAGALSVESPGAYAAGPGARAAAATADQPMMGLLASNSLVNRQVSVPTGAYGSSSALQAAERGGALHSAALAATSCPWPPASDSPPSSLTSPPDGATIATTTPALSAVSILTPGTPLYANCYPTAYDFKVMTAPGGGETVADSSWLYDPNNPSNITNWAIPQGALRDGETYYVAVQTDDSALTLTPLPATTITHFTVDLRKGGGGPSPTDTVGSTPSGTSSPAQGSPSPGLSAASETVNLVTGDLALTAGTHALQTVSGSAGVSLNYNSLDADLYGLDAKYYVDTGDHSFSGADTLIGQKVDPMIDFKWGLPSIGSLPLTGATGFLVHWTGTIFVPPGSPTVSAGSWQFGVQAGGGMLVCIDQSTTCGASNASVDSWTAGASAASPVFGSVLSKLAAGPHAITVETWVPEGPAVPTVLWIQNKTPSAPNPSPFVVPSSWLSSTPSSLPAGWSLSAESFNSAWTGLIDDGSQVVLTSSGGSTADFAGTGTGQAEVFQPPAGDTDLLTRNPDGTLRLVTRSGDVYAFTSNGLVSSITTARDAGGNSGSTPADLTYTYSGVPLQLTAITDPVSGRAITLNYNGNGTCPTSGSTGVALNAPVDMLCAISYWDGTQSTFAYNPQGELGEVANPGGVSRFAYDSAGRLVSLQDPLGFAAIQAGQRSDCPSTASGTPTCDTTVGYMVSASSCAASFVPSCAQVATVTQPAPTVGALQPSRSYCYADSPASGSCTPTPSTTTVSLAGFAPSAGFENKAVYNADGEITAETDPTGATKSVIWNAAEQPVVTVGTDGMQTTSTYNAGGEVVDKYGPAPAACFATTAPYLPLTNLSSCGVSAVPHTRNGYDEGITGPNTSIWSNTTSSGPPCQETTGLTGDTGLSHVWGTAAPACANANGAWSLQMTGLIDLPSTGTWTFQLASQSVLAVFLNGAPLGQATGNGAWGSTVTATVPVTTPGWQQLAVEYVPVVHPTGTQSNGFSVSYQPPPGGSSTVVPYSAVDPGYGLKTSSVDADGDVTITRYADATGGIDPIDGLATQTVKDPSTATVAADGMPATLGDAAGLSLTSTTTYEHPGPAAFFRKTATVLPAGGATTYSYYSGGQGPVAAVCGVTATTPQGGQLEQQTDPAPGTTSAQALLARTQQFVYNAAGQQVGVRVSDVKSIASAPWKCSSYDGSGRLTALVWPALGTKAGRTVTYTYAVGGNPLVNSVSDPSGTITSTVDLEGRVISYTDASSQTTTTSYDQAGQLVQTSSTVDGTITTSYDPNTGQPIRVAPAALPAATATYFGPTAGVDAGRLMTVNLGNGVTASYTYNSYGSESGVNYTNTSTSAPIASEAVQFTLAGRELSDGFTATTSATPAGGGSFTYDNAGRLTNAYLPGEQVEYLYNSNLPADNCADPNQGLDTNVTLMAVLPTGGSLTKVASCYNTSDQLTGTTTTNFGTGTTTTDSTFTYDTQGNQTADGLNTTTWDSSGRVAKVKSASGTDTYTFDALDRLIKKTVGTKSVYFAYCGLSANPCGTISSTKAAVSGYVPLLGGVVLTTVASSGSLDTWSLPDAHGNFMMTTSPAGTPSNLATYTPYGAPTIGSTSALANSGNTSSTLGAFGAAGKVTDTTPTDPVVLLGARLYNPAEGRFLSVDPIEGGCANPYVYVSGDPLNSNDLTGQAGCGNPPQSGCSMGSFDLDPQCVLVLNNNTLSAIAACGGAIDAAAGVTTIIAGALCAAATGGICGILAGFVTQLIEATLAAFLAAVGVEAYLGASMVLGVSLWGGLQYAFVGPGKPC